ncbi:MAG: monofunctional biosynthetic peptidoglycan transglycosylase [Acetobacteraceae bacterium]
MRVSRRATDQRPDRSRTLGDRVMASASTHARAARPLRGRLWAALRLLLLVFLLAPPVLILVYRFLPPPVTPLMLIRWAEGYPIRQTWVPYDAIAPTLAPAVIASEDNRFCEQGFGFDLGALREQVDAWWEGERPRGASTITMQTAKNLYLWPGRDPLRKLLEAWLTPQVALLWPKQRVLEVYLNVVEFGPGLYGAEAAARSLFRKPAGSLSAHEAAQLASVLPSPLVWSAELGSPAMRRRAAVIQRRVGQIRPLLACAQ